MKNSTKFWYSVLTILTVILCFIYFEEVLKLLLVFVKVWLLTYFLMSTAFILFSHIENKNILKFDFPKTLITNVLIFNNPLYFVFYTCITEFNNFLNKQ